MNHWEKLLELADICKQRMNPGDLKNLRASTESYIEREFGLNSIFHQQYKRIDRCNSQYTVNEIKGLLSAIAQDQERWLVRTDDDHVNLAVKIFYDTKVYNLEALTNLVKNNAQYFDFDEAMMETVFHRLIKKGMIARTGIGEAYTITSEGENLYKIRFSNSLRSDNIEKGNKKQASKEDVFLCHASKDKSVIRCIKNDLEAKGLSCWMDEEQIGYGENIIEKIQNGLSNCNVMIICVSENFLNSIWCEKESSAFLWNIFSGDNQRRVIPLIVDDTEFNQLPFFYNFLKTANYTDKEDYDKFLQSLLTRKQNIEHEIK